VSTWALEWRHAYESPLFAQFREALLLPDVTDVRAAVIDDLSSFYRLSPDECVQRCVNWEQWSVQEWQARSRDSVEAIHDFYRKMQSWSFDLLWYAYLQAVGHRHPVSVAIAIAARERGVGGGRHLDFGSGVGVTGQFFSRIGFQSDLADISTSLMEFARFRIARRGDGVGYIDLNTTQPVEGAYDLITAIDTFAHVADVPAAIAMLHRALKPGGLLFANFDTRPRAPENAWHLYESDRPLRWQLQRAGFEPDGTIGGLMRTYRRVEPAGLAHAVRGVRDSMLLKSPLVPAYRRVRRGLARG
jgi:SAM-dependent methyltransferase